MGSSPSKQQSKQNGQDLSWFRSMPLPESKSHLEAGEEGVRKLFWKSRLSSMPRMGGGESPIGSIFRPSPTLRQVPGKVLQEEPSELEQERDRSVGVSKIKSAKSLRRTLSFQPTWDSSPEPNSSLSQKLPKKEVSGAESTLNLSVKLDSVCDLLPHKDAFMERSAGLRSLLSPMLTPSHGFASPTRPANDPSKALAVWKGSNPRVNESSPGHSSFLARSSSSRGLPIGNKLLKILELSPVKSSFCSRSSSFRDLPILSNSQSKLEVVSTPDVLAEPGGSPLFDPLILATFEKALECLSDDSHQSSDFISNDNSSSASESESSLDLESLVPQQDGMVGFEGFGSVSCQDARMMCRPPTLRASAFLNRKVSFSRVFSLKNGVDWSGTDYLDRFEMICPPGGEQKVILYFTSLRAVRKTFEDCCMLRLILKGLRMLVDERDVWMHSKFRRELTEIMGVALPVPQLFILGRYIGGAEEVEQLHEEGILGKMLAGFVSDTREECKVCRDVRFIPCITCFGSCKYYSEEEVVERCPDCNENGLILCPHCD